MPCLSSTPGHGEHPAEAALCLSEAKKGGSQGPFSLLSDSGEPHQLVLTLSLGLREAHGQDLVDRKWGTGCGKV